MNIRVITQIAGRSYPADPHLLLRISGKNALGIRTLNIKMLRGERLKHVAGIHGVIAGAVEEYPQHQRHLTHRLLCGQNALLHHREKPIVIVRCQQVIKLGAGNQMATQNMIVIYRYIFIIHIVHLGLLVNSLHRRTTKFD